VRAVGSWLLASQPDDQVAQLSAWLAGLSEDDRQFVMELVKRTYEHLRR
jgi:hypothetical protein